MTEYPEITPKKEKRKQVQPKHHTTKTGATKPLSVKQRRFIEEYLVDFNAAQACIRAGYNPKNAKVIGCENLTKPNIKIAIDVALKQRSERTEITADYVLTTIRETVERCKRDPFNPSAMLKGAELLGKHLALFTEKHMIGLDIATVELILSALPPEYAEAVQEKLQVVKMIKDLPK